MTQREPKRLPFIGYGVLTVLNATFLMLWLGPSDSKSYLLSIAVIVLSLVAALSWWYKHLFRRAR